MTRTPARIAVVVALAMQSLGCAASHVASTCSRGSERACACASGEPGVQTCAPAGRSYEACRCSAADGGVSCTPGRVVACSCEPGTSGTATCDDDGELGACACRPDAGATDAGVSDAGPCPFFCERGECPGDDQPPDPEHPIDVVCRDSLLPFEGSVYLLGDVGEWGENVAVAAIHPRRSDLTQPLAAALRGGFAAFDPAGVLHHASSIGVVRNDTNATLDAPPCHVPDGGFGWDALGRFLYSCGDLRRDNGELIARDLGGWIEGVLPSGRTVIGGTIWFDLLEADGPRSTRFGIPRASPHWYVVPHASTTTGEHAFVVVRGGGYVADGWLTDLVVARVDGDTSAWRPVRRLRLPHRVADFTMLALPDGTVLITTIREASSPPFDTQVLAIPVDGPSYVVWEETAADPLAASVRSVLFAGPRDAL